jgi:dUTP pyrophosphatase
MADPIVPCTGSPDAIPRYQSESASGADLCAQISSDVVLAPGARVLIPTGLRLSIPRGLEGQVRPRSGLASRHGVTVLNSPGTIDSDYRGEVKVILINLGQEPFTIRNGERIAQLVFSPVVRVAFQPGASVDDTMRGSGGFGSTGK